MDIRSRLLAIGLLAALGQPAGAQERKDHFIGTMVLEDVDPVGGRKFKLGQDLTYVDPNGMSWYARQSLVFDGASIPQVLWSIVGSPYTGLYRRAAVIHDWYCTNLYRPWQDVHRAFYDAMITDGVSFIKAKLMYYAVVRFGPRWTVAQQTNCPTGFSCVTMIVTQVDLRKVVPKPDLLTEQSLRSELSDVESAIARDSLSLAEVETLAMGQPAVPVEVQNKTLIGIEAMEFARNRR